MTPEREAEILADIHQGKTRNARKYLELGDESGLHYSIGDFDLPAVRRVYGQQIEFLKEVLKSLDDGMALSEDKDTQPQSWAKLALEEIAEMVEQALKPGEDIGGMSRRVRDDWKHTRGPKQ